MPLLPLWLPLMSFFCCSLLGRSLGQSGACFISCSLLGSAFLVSWDLAYLVVLGGEDSLTILWDWIPLAHLQVEVGFVLDSLSSLMLTIVFSVSFLVHVYSSSYMWGDPHLPRFMSYLSLFTFFMALLVQSSNVALLFIGWEGVGLCSYLLVNFWFSSLMANTSAIKAMLVNSVGDLAMILAMGILFYSLGGLSWEIISQCYMDPSASTGVCVLLLVGAAGKSAQLGLHTWLPDAMEGPTPVSALIHAATMVTAGVFLILSCAPLFEGTSSALLITVLLGSITAFFAASAGLSQTDMKKVIAYSTTSQLGYMVASCGLCYFSMGFNHLINHAYFKALLFLSAGAMIHANWDEQDLSSLGLQWIISPLSLICIIMGSISLMGFPFMTGFYSKDLILELSSTEGYPSWMFVLLLAGAGLTAAYSTKIIALSFAFPPLMGSVKLPPTDYNQWNMLFPLMILAAGSISLGFLTQGWVNLPFAHPLLESAVKCLPLTCSMGASLGALLFYFSSNSTHMSNNTYFSELNHFLFNAWQFNFIISLVIVSPLWTVAHHHTYKVVDKGWMEGTLPLFYSSKSLLLSQKLSSIQSGKTLNYMTLLIVFFTLVAALTYS